MRRLSRMLLFLALAADSVQAQTFGSVAIGGGGYVDGLISCATKPNLFYARTDVGGAYRWDEPTQSWIALLDWNSPSQLSYQGVEAMAVDPQSPNRLYLVVGTSYFNNGITAVLSSSDYGGNFTVVDVTSLFKAHGNGNDRNKGEELAVDPNLGSILFCGSRANGLFKSANYGASWSPVSSFNANINLGTDSISFVKFDPKSGAAGAATPRILVGVFRTGNNLFVSEDGGASWSAVAGSPSASVPERCELAGNNLLYIAYGTGTNGCLLSYNVTNQVWGNCTPGGLAQTYGAISICATNPNLMIASTYSIWTYQPNWGGYGDKIYVSTNAGASWNDLFANSKVNFDANGFPWITGGAIHWAGTIVMDPFNPNRVFVGSGNGIFSTANLNSGITTATWKFMVKGLEETVPVTFLSVPSGPLLSSLADINGFVHTDILIPPSSRISSKSSGFACAAGLTNFLVRAADGGSLYYSTGVPVNWTQFSTTPAGMAGGTPAVAADGKTVLWNATVSNANTCYVTTNQGVGWTASAGLTFGCQPQADPVNPSKFYAYNSGNGYVYVSTDGGLNFTSTGSAGSGGPQRFAIAPGREGHVWVARNGNGLQCSTNSGVTFYSAGVTEADAVAFGKAAPEAAYPTLFIWGRPTGSSTVGMYRSTDRAASWVRVNDYAHQYGGLGNAGMIEGDKNVCGRVYMSSAGRGILYMDSSPQTNYYNQAVLAYHPVALYELNEVNNPSAGGLAAYDCAGGFNGTYGNNARNGFFGIYGPVLPAFPGFQTNNTALKTTATLANSFVTAPAWNLNTNTVTMLAWIYPLAPAVNAGFIFCRAGSTVAGFHYGGTPDAQGRPTLGYTWNNDAATIAWNSGLVVPTNQWSMITLVVSPTNATAYVMNTNGNQSAWFVHSHANASFNGATLIGSDSLAQSRTFEGLMDEVAVFNTCLTAAQVQNVFNAGMGIFINPPQLVQPPAGLNVYAGTTGRLGFTATGDALQYQWRSGAVGSGVFTNVPLGGRFSLGANGALVISNVMLGDQLDYVVSLSNSVGAAVSRPATLAVRQPEVAASVVLGCGPVAFYELNELGNPAAGGVAASDSMGAFNGAYGTTAQNGYNYYAGPRPSAYPGFWLTNMALEAAANDANSIVTLPNLNLNTNTVSIVAWIKPNTLANDRGVVYCRGNGTTAGLCMGNHGDNALGYNWNDNPSAYNWDSGLVPNLNEWALVALVVSPSNAVIYLMSPTKGMLSATNPVANVNQSFANPATIGTDVFGSGRTWDGGIDDVSVFKCCLSRSQVTSLFTAGSGIGAPTASFALGPTSGANSVTVNFTNTTTGTVVSGLWSFGDGATSTNMSSSRIQHTYSQSGCVAATNLAILAVTNSGWVSVFTNTSPIIIYPPAPASIFALSAPAAATNQAVFFTNLTTGCASTWLWNFGDGATSTLVNPTHAYAATGTYNVTLAATNAYGLGAVSLAQAMMVTNMPAPPIIRPVSLRVTSVSILQSTNVQLVGSNFPASANAPFNVLWTTNLHSPGLGWLTNVNTTGDHAFNGTSGWFTNVVVNGAEGSGAFFRIQVP